MLLNCEAQLKIQMKIYYSIINIYVKAVFFNFCDVKIMIVNLAKTYLGVVSYVFWIFFRLL